MPKGIYEINFQEFEERFCKNLSDRRDEIIKQYKKHFNEIKDCDYAINHWVDGSFVSSEENPGDIDTLTEFDGLKIDELNIENQINVLIDEAPLRTAHCCHSLKVYKYPENYKEEHDFYLYTKSKILFIILCE